MDTLKSQSNGPLYSNRVIGTLAVHGWAVLVHDAMQARPMSSCGVCLSICLCVSVCPSRSCILSKRINISSNFFHYRVAKPC